jgi:hypothetical protein
MALLPLASAVLPEVLRSGLRHVSWTATPRAYLTLGLYCALAIPGAVGAYLLARRRHNGPALALLALVMSAGWLYLKLTALPAVDLAASARPLWNRVRSQREDTCVETLNRALRYGLNYYSVQPLPDCAVMPKPLHIIQAERQAAQVVPAGDVALPPTQPPEEQQGPSRHPVPLSTSAK